MSSVTAGAAAAAAVAAPQAASADDVARVGRYVVTRAPGTGVAVCFGWVGSQDRHLSKYASAWHAAGVGEVWRTTLPTLDLFVRPSKQREAARELLRELAARHPDAPIFLWYSSNGGAFVHEQLQHVLAEEGAPPALRIAGVAFDSAPAWLSLQSGSRAISEGIRNPLARRLVYCTMWLGLLLIYLPASFLRLARPPGEYFKRMAAGGPLPVPAWYVYSSTDRITDPRKLQELVQERARRLGCPVESVLTSAAASAPASPPSGPFVRELFIDHALSPHCTHLLRHPEHYARELTRFVADALTLWRRNAPPL